MTTVSFGGMKGTPARSRQHLKTMSPDMNYGLGIAKVTNINYEEFQVTLRTVSGASQSYERVPVPMTFPGAGARHFLGAMPQIGDTCVVGWMSQESAEGDGGTKTPVILAWLIPGVFTGRDWATTAEVEVDEYDLESPSDQVRTAGAYDRIRHKLRHMQPGNVVASSAQGADLVLDEGVTLSNRRGNEFRLRDQDQAVILRSLQEFHTQAGTRLYSGMVQRDAQFLASSMISDGLEWDSALQSIEGVPVQEGQLSADATAPAGFLTPSLILRKKSVGSDEGYLGKSFLNSDPYLDPYAFLRLGGFINSDGFAVPQSHAPAIYGGKPLFRVSSQNPENTVTDPNARTLTEFRLEVTHTSDGRLPVSEQTDLFDAERLPGQDPTASPMDLPSNAPFIEWVLGSVVGNDPYSQDGRLKYGVPLKAVIFDGNTAAPRLEPVQLAQEGSGVSPTPLKEHAATLFRLIPPLPGGGAETFWSVNKQGQLKAAFGGKVTENSLEAYLAGGLKLGIGGRFQLLMNGHMELGTISKSSLHLTAQEGAVRIFGGGPLVGPSNAVERTVGQGGADTPAVSIEARTNALLKAEKKVTIKGGTLDLNASTISIVGNDNLDISGVKQTSITTETWTTSVNGQCQQSFGGPKYGLPTNAPLHDRTYAPLIPGITCEKVTYAMGNREELFNLGNHTTTVLVGDMTYQTVLGTWKAQSAGNSLALSATGLTGNVLTGTISLSAAAGTATMSGLAGVNLVAGAGLATVRGSVGVYLGGPITGPDFGPIICAGSREPFTNLPFATWGLGARNHTVGP
jgi:hypothetical protein